MNNKNTGNFEDILTKKVGFRRGVAYDVTTELRPDGDGVPMPQGTLILLVPARLIESLPEGTSLTSVMNECVIVGRDHLDDDHRGDMSSYGVPTTDRSTLARIGKALLTQRL